MSLLAVAGNAATPLLSLSPLDVAVIVIYFAVVLGIGF